MKPRLASSSLLALGLVACGAQPPLAAPPPAPPPVASVVTPPNPPEPVRVTPDASFRSAPPPAGPAVTWAPPRIDSWSLKNGVRVLFVERHDLPIVSVRVVSGAGAGDVRGARPGVVAFMGGMLEQGAGSRTSLALSDDYAAMGAEHAAWCDWDACVASVKVLTSHLGPALDLLSDVALRPTFPDAELERLRKRWLGSIQQEKNSPTAMEQNALAAAVFGRAHPYGHSLRGQTADVEKVTRAEVEGTWRRVFEPRSTTLVVAGDVTSEQLRPLLERRFGGWKGGAAARMPVSHAFADRKATKVVLIDAPGAAQSQVYLAEEGAPFATPDRIPIGIMNLILGGMFSSRINLELREAKAYTYGAHSGFALRHGAGAFAAGGAIFAEHTADAARAIAAQIDRMRAEPVSAEELADAKENAKLALPARFESVEELTGVLEDMAVYEMPLDEYAQRAARIDAVTAADVQRVAKKWLHPEAMRIVIAGDRAKVEHSLMDLGAVETRDAYGDLVR
ncbi:MAG TPA: pitrilysin family protein [Polyangiaceae bacterium]|nr:pitrilysin family protein [Polyangiaceae bacterium]